MENEKDACIPSFYLKAVQHKASSRREGRPIHVNREYVKILIPGQRDTVDRPVQEADKSRWPAAWERFVKNQEQHDGTPLEQWRYLNPAQVANLKSSNVFTIEELAAVSDGNLQNLGMGARDLRDRARQHLKPQDEVETELRAENADLRNQVKSLHAQLEAMKNTPEPEKKRRGRPPKDEAA